MWGVKNNRDIPVSESGITVISTPLRNVSIGKDVLGHLKGLKVQRNGINIHSHLYNYFQLLNVLFAVTRYKSSNKGMSNQHQATGVQ